MQAQDARAQQLANLDNWLNFDNKSESWSPGFDKSFAPEIDQQPERGYPSISAANIEPMKAAIKRYAGIVENGGWNIVPEVELRVGMTHPAVAELRLRLQIEGDLGADAGRSETFDYYVEKAVKTAQTRHGLAPTGVVDKETLEALNVPASAILRKLRTNLTRIQTLAAPTKGRYVFVNIPAAQIEAVENDQVVSRHIGVVGKYERQTPVLESEIHEINFNKEWILPPTVIREDLLPKARGKEGIKVFERYGVDIYRTYNDYLKNVKLDPAATDWNDPQAEKFFYAQEPGRDNPLGFLKINFPNSHAVFMHDTPGKELFTRNYRADSSGCIRIQNIELLAAWLLDGEGWDLERVNEMKVTGESLNVPIRNRVKLYFAYVTAWATPDGVAHFRPDIYERDGVGVTATVY